VQTEVLQYVFGEVFIETAVLQFVFGEVFIETVVLQYVFGEVLIAALCVRKFGGKNGTARGWRRLASKTLIS
jgi:hypothetical protein